MTKALYGLRTSPKQWQEHLSATLHKLGFRRLKSEACVLPTDNRQSTSWPTLTIYLSLETMWLHNNAYISFNSTWS
eukprot:4337842-Amphidinium_carterae.1